MRRPPEVEEAKELLVNELRDPANSHCADCGDRAEFANLTLGVFNCGLCADIHRSMRRRVRHAYRDDISIADAMRLVDIGNARSRRKWMAHYNPRDYTEPTPRDDRQTIKEFIWLKYEGSWAGDPRDYDERLDRFPSVRPGPSPSLQRRREPERRDRERESERRHARGSSHRSERRKKSYKSRRRDSDDSDSSTASDADDADNANSSAIAAQQAAAVMQAQQFAQMQQMQQMQAQFQPQPQPPSMMMLDGSQMYHTMMPPAQAAPQAPPAAQYASPMYASVYAGGAPVLPPPNVPQAAGMYPNPMGQPQPQPQAPPPPPPPPPRNPFDDL